MAIPETGKHSLSFLIRWSFSGALIFTMVALLGRGLDTTPMNFGHLWLPVVFGGLVGLISGLAANRLRSMRCRLEESERRFWQFCQGTPAMLHSMDSEGRLLDVSQSWLNTLGYDRKDVLGKNFFSFVDTDDPEKLTAEHFQRLNELGEIKVINYQLRCAMGSVIEVSISEIAQRDSEGCLTGSMAVLTDLTGHRAAEERIERLAYYDALTGLPNRVLMSDRILQSVAQARRDNRQVGVFFFDLDRFKLINDTQGHAVGDLILRSVAERLKKFIREGDTFARLGGDEFVILQADPNHDPNFMTMGRRILETLRMPFQIGSREFFTTASIGLAVYPVDGEEPQTLLKNADTAMYVAKSRGRNNLQFYSDDMNAAALVRADFESRLRYALKSGGLQQYYQPQVNLETGRIVGVEALLRWSDSDGNVILPAQIIEIAEESGLVFPLGEWVLQTACTQARIWQDAGMPPLRMSINLSGHHLRQANFIDRIESILNETGLNPDTLEIELAENSIMGQLNDNIAALTDLKVLGINLAVDNFGTGYSSLLYLRHLPIHRIKIAQEFVRDIIHNPDYAAITEAILSMAGSLNVLVTAVGVEDSRQLAFLRERGCLEAQGQLFGAAMGADDMTALLISSGGVLPQARNRQDPIELENED